MLPNTYIISKKTVAYVDRRMDCDTVRNLFRGFCFGTCELETLPGEDCRFVVGEPQITECPADQEYAIFADAKGLAVVAHSYPSLMRGYIALLMKIDNVNIVGQLGIAPVCERSNYVLSNRMIHFCIFPETDWSLFRRYVRLAAVLGYTHAVLEFWGTLRLDCCPELGWRDASVPIEQVRALSREMHELGIEPIPMINHLGHAPSTRGRSGKHVVLDQDPSKYALFTPDGWSWNTHNPAARKLLADARAQLYELLGEGQYFHCGLDESDMYAKVPALFDSLPEYLGSLTHAIADEGRRPMIWMDMLLPPEAYGDSIKNVDSINSPEKCRRVMEALHPSTVLVDWEYKITQAPVPSSLYLKNSGFDVIGAPWLNVQNGEAHIKTATDHGLFGVMLTTWHTMASELNGMIPFARSLGAAKAPWSDITFRNAELATLMRKLTFESLSYEQTGWMNHQIVCGAERTV